MIITRAEPLVSVIRPAHAEQHGHKNAGFLLADVQAPLYKAAHRQSAPLCRQGAAMIERIEGCYFNVVGLPIHGTKQLLQKAGYFDETGKDR